MTIRDVATMAGVSPATVSNVLGGRKPVAAALAQRVRSAAKELKYEADRAASQLRSGRARVVAVLVPDLDNPFYTAVISAVEDRARQDGYEVIVASSREDEATEYSRLSSLLAWRPAGLVVISCSDRFAGYALLDRAGTPYVLADREPRRLTADTVSIDGEEAGAMGAAHLLERGHEKVLIAASTLKIGNMRERCDGAVQEFRRHGVTAPDIVELGLSFEAAVKSLRRWFDRSECPSAVLALTNFTTLSALTVLAERGLPVPERISLIGFDDYSWMRARVTPLTAIRQPVDEMGRMIWDSLSARIGGDRSPPKRCKLSCELMVRSSTAKASGVTARRSSDIPTGSDTGVRRMDSAGACLPV